jgi:hypothetical protein
LRTFLKELQDRAGAELMDIDAPSYPNQVHAMGFD